MNTRYIKLIPHLQHAPKIVIHYPFLSHNCFYFLLFTLFTFYVNYLAEMDTIPNLIL